MYYSLHCRTQQNHLATMLSPFENMRKNERDLPLALSLIGKLEGGDWGISVGTGDRILNERTWALFINH